MADIIAIGFDDAAAATDPSGRLDALLRACAGELRDAVIVERDDEDTMVMQAPLAAPGADLHDGAFWGLVVGLLMTSPVEGLDAGGATDGALLDDEVAAQIATAFDHGAAAVFLRVKPGAVGHVRARVDLVPGARTVSTLSLSADEEAELAAFWQMGSADTRYAGLAAE